MLLFEELTYLHLCKLNVINVIYDIWNLQIKTYTYLYIFRVKPISSIQKRIKRYDMLI